MATAPLDERIKLDQQASLGQVVSAELEEIRERRARSVGCMQQDQTPPPEGTKWFRQCHDMELFGVCLSGGGIRSATFSLGVLQGLVEKKLLCKADYISTVSGGGYIGAWLQGVAYREPNYEKVLDPKRKPDLAEKDPITFLRKYSNYLAPRNGLSLDFLVIPLIWFRNMMLNQAIIVSAIVALYILMLAPGAGLRYMALNGTSCPAIAMLVLSLAVAAVVVVQIGAYLRRIVQREFSPDTAAVQPAAKILKQHVASYIAIPLFFAVLLLVYALAVFPLNAKGLVLEYLSLFALVALLQWGGGFLECYSEQREIALKGLAKDDTKAAFIKKKSRVIPVFHIFWMSLISAAFMTVLVGGIWRLCEHWKASTAFGCELIIAWAPPLYFLALIAGVGLHIGLMGRDFPDASREWLARLGALILGYISIWAALFALAIFAPLGIAELWQWGRHRMGAWIVSSGVGAWLMTTLMSVLAGKSSRSGAINPDQRQSSTVDLIARYGPLIAVPGFLVVVAFGTQLLLHPQAWFTPDGLLASFDSIYWNQLPLCGSNLLYAFFLLLAAIAVFGILSLRVNINEFSMHHFYKNRLVRCYLGASATKLGMKSTDAEQRSPDPFTGFDPKDDLKLYKLRTDEQDRAHAKPRVPFPIINAALTVTAGVELATQERKALPWFFTPLYSGFFPTRSYSDRKHRGARGDPYADSQIISQGLDLGTATAISGAAVNPNMGFHSSPQTAFLLTLFNVRLGWWLGNPTRGIKIATNPGPPIALWWLARELFGFVDEGSAYVNLSDGGHFENLGLYELIRRRCHYIIVVDAEEDPDYLFESLGGAVRKCRADFGVEIEIDPRPIVSDPKFSRTHCVVGRVKYPAEERAHDGLILYLKASITGDEPADVEEYRRENSAFPQQSTADQFFSESQFESYRKLGLHVAQTVLAHIVREPEPAIKDVFERLRTEWLLPPAAPEGAAARHSSAYTKLLADLAKCPASDDVILKDFPTAIAQAGAERSAFFLHLQLLQLIEEVYLDLDFGNQDKWEHPANAGWKDLILYWAGRPAMRAVWKLQRSSYGEPFRTWLDDRVRTD